MQRLVKDIEEISACCSASVEEYNATGLPKGVSAFSRCTKCGEMSEVLFLSPDGENIEYHDAHEEISDEHSLAKYVANYIREESESGTFEIIDTYDNLTEVITNAINTYKGDT